MATREDLIRLISALKEEIITLNAYIKDLEDELQEACNEVGNV